MKFKSLISVIVVLLMSFARPSSASSLSEGTSAVLGVDFETGDIAYQYNIDRPVGIASTTKLMTYLVVMDEIVENKRSGLDERITIDEETAQIGGSTFDLRQGEIFTVEELLEALLIVSGNDACYALAGHFAGDEYNFVEKMNYKASELGLESAVFYTSSGLPDSSGQNNLMSARDLYRLSAHIVEKYPEILEITSKPLLIYEQRNYSQFNTNPLIGKLAEVDGLKTGFTNLAGRCLVATGVQADGNRVIGILMGADSEGSRAEKSEKLMTHILTDYKKQKLYSQDHVIETINLGNSAYREIEVSPLEDVEVFIRDGEVPVKKIRLEEDIKAPIKKGHVIGEMTLEYGENIRHIDITVSEDISRFKMARIIISNFLSSLF